MIDREHAFAYVDGLRRLSREQECVGEIEQRVGVGRGKSERFGVVSDRLISIAFFEKSISARDCLHEDGTGARSGGRNRGV